MEKLVLETSGGGADSSSVTGGSSSRDMAVAAGSGEGVGGSGRTASTASNNLKTALQRLFGAGAAVGGPDGELDGESEAAGGDWVGVGQEDGSSAGRARQPLWLYINHLGWCRGPFSGAKLMHAHLCGRLPRDTLIVGYDPGVPTFMLSGDAKAWFR